MKNVNIKMENDPDFIEDPRQGRGNVKLKILFVIPAKAGIQNFLFLNFIILICYFYF